MLWLESASLDYHRPSTHQHQLSLDIFSPIKIALLSIQTSVSTGKCIHKRSEKSYLTYIYIFCHLCSVQSV